MKINRLIILAAFLLSCAFSSFLSAQNPSCLNLDLEKVDGASIGETVCVDVRVRNFGDVIGMQYTHLYDATGLDFVEIQAGALGINTSNYNDLSAGVLTFSWIESSLQPMNITDETVLYSICFEVTSGASVQMEISFSNDPTAIEFVQAPATILQNYGLAQGGIALGNVSDSPMLASSCVSSIDCSQNGNGGVDLTMTGAGPFTYNWSGPNGFAATTEDISGLELEGQYEVTITNGDGAERNVLFQVSYEDEGDLLIVAQPDNCGGSPEGSLSASVIGGSGTYTYLWSTGATTAEITNLAAGSYTVTATGVNSSCEYIQSAEVETIGGFTDVVIITDTDCTGNTGTIDLTINAASDQLPLSYQWSNGAASEDLTGLAAGTYTVTVTGTSCTSEFLYMIFNASFPVEGTITQPNCQNSNGSITLTSPDENGPYTYSWSDGMATRNLDNIPAGTYTVTVTDTESGCTSEEAFTLNAGNLEAAWAYECSVLTDTTIVELTVLLWNPSALPVYYSYSDGSLDTVYLATEASSIFINENQNYSVTITDGNGCQTSIQNINVDCDSGVNTVDLSLSPVTQQLDVSESFCMTVRADDFTNMTSAQFSLAWDPALLSYTGTSQVQFPNTGEFFHQTSQDILDGRLRFAWVVDDVLNGFTLPDNSPLFDVCFTALAEGQTSLTFVNDPIPIELTDNQPQTLAYTTASASINIGPAASGAAAVRLGIAIVETGETACVPVLADDLNNILSWQGTISWDETILAFDEVTDFNLPGLGASAFGTNFITDGKLTFAWIEPNSIPYSANPGETLFSICFTPLVTSGFSDVSFTSTPTMIEMIDGDLNEIIPDLTDGYVAITENIIWPGDTDQNEIVDHFDLLNIGLGFGQTGSARIQATTNWVPQYTAEWDNATPESGTNYHHADTDGNGTIDASDVDALQLNWDEITTLWTPSSGQQRNLPFANQLNNAPLYIQAETVELGATVPFKVMYGNEETPAEGVYGIAFSINYDPEAVVAGSVEATFETSWMGTLDDNLLAVARDYPDEHRLDIAITRTDGESIDGSGQIATMYITIEDVIFRNDLYEMEFSIDNVRAITAEEIGIHTTNLVTISTIDISTGIDEPDAFAQLRIQPNPVTDMLYIKAGEIDIERIELFHLSGVRMATHLNMDRLSVSHLPAGTYYLQFSGPEGVATRRFIKH